MEVFLDCLPCFLKQALEAARLVTDDKETQEKIMAKAINFLSTYKDYRFAPEIGRRLHQIVKEQTDNNDPYCKLKKANINAALEIYPDLKRFLYKKQNKLYWVLKIAATGNIIDAAIFKDIKLEFTSVIDELEKPFVINDLEILEEKLPQTKSLLIIGDNAGETVFDRVLVESLINFNISYSVRSEPIINDATMEDAKASGLLSCTNIISTGCNAPGVILEEGSEEFRACFDQADIVISKGQGNYETLSEEKRDIFFLLKAKCPVIGNRLGVNVNDYVFKYKAIC